MPLCLRRPFSACSENCPRFPSTSRVGSNRGVPTMAAFLFHDPTPMSFLHVGWLVRFLRGIDSGRIGCGKGLRDTSTRHSRGSLWNEAKVEESFGALLKNRAKHPIRWSLSSSHWHYTVHVCSSSKQDKLAGHKSSLYGCQSLAIRFILLPRCNISSLFFLLPVLGNRQCPLSPQRAYCVLAVDPGMGEEPRWLLCGRDGVAVCSFWTGHGRTRRNSNPQRAAISQ